MTNRLLQVCFSPFPSNFGVACWQDVSALGITLTHHRPKQSLRKIPLFCRISQSLKTQDWAAIRIEFVLLVLSVFLGIQVANWNEARAETLVGDDDARARALKVIDDYLVNPPEFISSLVPWALVVLGEVDRGLTTFADHQASFDGAFLGNFIGARMFPEVWASPAFPSFLRKTGLAAYWDELGAPEDCPKDAGGDYRCK